MKRVELHQKGDDFSLYGYIHEPIAGVPVVGSGLRPAIIIFPGGGYQHVSPRESDPPAEVFYSYGYNTFVVTYPVGERAAHLAALKAAVHAVARIRRNAGTLFVDPERIAVMGFSAGGHLAASLAVHWNHPYLITETPDVDAELARPNALVLSYPVLVGGPYTHEGSMEKFCQGDERAQELFSLEKHVSPELCPVFMWHTAEDATVPVENSLLFALSLSRAHIPFEYHVFPSGAHGLSVCTVESGTPHERCSRWVGLAKQWLDDTFQHKL